jgi:ERCC4-type nuclease
VILVDDRAGSDKLGLDLRKAGLPIQFDRLDGGDVMFLGQGPSGECTVGVEHKTLRDLLQSLRSQRLQGHQLHEMQVYDFRFLLIEGDYRHDDAGYVTMRTGAKEWSRVAGNFRASELDKTLIGLTLRGGICIKEVSTRRESVRWLTSLYRNFTDVEWTAHTSHTGVHRPAGLVRPSPFRNFICGIPNVGLKTSKAIEAYFGAVPRRAVAARWERWAEIDGIGKKGATQIDKFLEGE